MNISQGYYHIVSFKLLIKQTHHLGLLRVCDQVLHFKHVVLVFFVLILGIKIWTIKIKKTMAEFVASYGFHAQVNRAVLHILQR